MSSEKSKNNLAERIKELPEVYQPVYGHPRLSGKVSRPCTDRLQDIVRVYDALQTLFGRPLRVLDLGCAQGFFSFNLAERGAIVHGVDYLDKNIAVCEAIAEEHPDFKVSFETGRIEPVIERLEKDQYDLVLGLSVFHHIIHEKGVEAVKALLERAAVNSAVLIIESALKEEPLYWAPAQPEDPRLLFAQIAFVHELARHGTHLAPVPRPLYAASNRYWVLGDHAGAFETWTEDPHAFALGTHEGSRRYFFSPAYVVKLYRFDHRRGEYNRQEFAQAEAFLKNVPSDFPVATCVASESNETEGWTVLERKPGCLLLDLLREGAELDRMAILRSVLHQLVLLEKAGLYHNDVRVWNVLVDQDGSAYLIDYGSISTQENDCMWPENRFLSFFIFVHELTTGVIDPPDALRNIAMTPRTLPAPYSQWGLALWKRPLRDWSFKMMYDALKTPSGKPVKEEAEQPVDAWAVAIEEALELQRKYLRHLKERINAGERFPDELIDLLSRTAAESKVRAETAEEILKRMLAETKSLAEAAEVRFNKLEAGLPGVVAAIETRAQKAEQRAENAEQRAEKAEKKAQRAEEEIRRHQSGLGVQEAVAEVRIQHLEVSVQQAEERIRDAETRSQKSELRAQEAESRGQRAEDRARKAEERAKRAEIQAQQSAALLREASEARLAAVRAEKAAAEAEVRAQRAEVRNQEAESRGQRAEDRARKAEKELYERMTELVMVQDRLVAVQQELAETTVQMLEQKRLAERNAGQRDLFSAQLEDVKAGQIRLRSEIDAMTHSISWKCAAPIRWAGVQWRRLRGEGPVSRLKALVKKILRFPLRRAIDFIDHHPVWRFRVIGFSRRLKIHALLKNVYWKGQGLPVPEMIPDDAASGGSSVPGTEKKVAVLAPGAEGGSLGGAERFYSGLVRALREKGCKVDLIHLTFDESNFQGIQKGYEEFAGLDLSTYDMVISTKAPAFVAKHPNHVLYLVHTVRVFYDMFDETFPSAGADLRAQRSWIHKIDSEAFGRISKRFSIGAEVSRRLEEWNGIGADVLHPPMDLSGLYDSGIGDYFFMPGRLHPWKRVDLAIRAVKKSSLPLRLLISGSGEAEASLKELAGGDRRIEFLGRVDDARLKKLYAGALAVPFVPIREDYGYITLEAFASGKPVVTCTDSGEPARFVKDGETGIVCLPETAALCSAFERLWNDRDLAAELGKNGRISIEHIQWPTVAEKLLQAGFGASSFPAGLCRQKMKVAVLDMQPILPAVGGGRLRLLGLYHNLGSGVETRYIGSYDWPGECYRRHRITSSLEETDIPLSQKHHEAASEASRKAGGRVVIDMIFHRQAALSPDYVSEAVAAVKWADVVVFSHPWVAPLVEDDLLEGKTVVYDSHNVELELRRQLLDLTNSFEREILKDVDFAERKAGNRADLILACSEEDAQAFSRIYGWSRSRIKTVPNGVFANRIQPASDGLKKEFRTKLGLENGCKVGFFIGSNYDPNLEAANAIIRKIAPKCPEVLFVIGGGVCERIRDALQPNVRRVGFLNENQKAEWLQVSDFALNPMTSGSGTNIKMFDFMAAGLPVVTTDIGARGILQASTVGIRICSIEQFSGEIRNLLSDPSALQAGGAANRQFTENRFSWERISPELGRLLTSRFLRKRGDNLLRTPERLHSERIAHLTTIGLKCGIGEYTKKIIEVYKKAGIENLILTCDSALEKATLKGHGCKTKAVWHFDNRSWKNSTIDHKAIDAILEWRGSAVLIQYHAGFYPAEELLSFVRTCLQNGVSASVIVHRFEPRCVAAFKKLNELRVTLFSHSLTEIRKAAELTVDLEWIPHGVDVQPMLKDRTIRQPVWDKGGPVIVTNGFLRKHKGVVTLIQSMPLILEKFPAAKLQIQCALYPSDDSREELENCKKQIEETGLQKSITLDSRFLDKKMVLEKLAEADLAVLPYDESDEGASGSASDALAVGLPLIVSPARIFDEVRDVALTVNPDPSLLANAMIEVLSSAEKYNSLANSSAEYAREHSWGTIAGGILTDLTKSNQE